MSNFKFTSLLLRLLLGFLYLSAGLSKLGEHSFGNIIGPVDLTKMAEAMNMPHWPFHFVTLFQIITGAMLMSRKYYRAGILLVIPLSVGLVIFTLGWGATLYINIFFLVLAIILFFLEWNQLKLILNKQSRKNIIAQGRFIFSDLMMLFAILAFACGILFPNQVLLLMLLAVGILICCFLEWTEIPRLFIIDKTILALYAFNITIIGMAIPIMEWTHLPFRTILTIFGAVLLLAGLLYLVRLILYRNISSPDHPISQ